MNIFIFFLSSFNKKIENFVLCIIGHCKSFLIGYLGVDCRNLQLGSIQLSSPPPPSPSGSSRNGMSPQPTPPSTPSSSRNGISNGGKFMQHNWKCLILPYLNGLFEWREKGRKIEESRVVLVKNKLILY